MKKLCVLVAVLFTMVMVHAQEKKNDAKPEDTSIARIKLANQLAKYGYETFSASALIEAAQILSEVQTQKMDGIKYEQGKGEDVRKDNAPEVISITKLIKDAKEFADGDATLLAMAEKVKTDNANTRGAVGGPKSGSNVVYGGTIDTYTISFKKGVTAEIAVSGNGASDLDLYVYDENGNLIVGDEDYSDDCYVCWTPAWTGGFIVKVVNRGRYSNYYNIATN